MGEFARKSDGRPIFTVEFKRGIVQQLVKGEKTPGGGEPGARHPAQRHPGVEAPGRNGGDDGRGRERGCRAGQRAAGGPAADSGARAAPRPEADGGRDPAGGAGGGKKKSVVAQRVREVTGHPVATICRTLRLARQTTYYTPTVRRRGHYQRAVDLKLFDFDIGAHPFFLYSRYGQKADNRLGSCSVSARHITSTPWWCRR